MLNHYRTKVSQASTPLPKPTRWWGWRRKRETHYAAWEHVKESDSDTRTECYQRLMQASELTVHEGEYEYQIWPEGQRPALF